MHKILIIEDDELIANIYRNKFLIEGFQVETASNAETGLQLVRSFHPHAVLLDLMLPKMNGVEFMKEIRAEQAFSKLPLIVFSNMYLTNLVREAWKAGATKCLSKANSNPQQVIAAVRHAMGADGETAAGAPTNKTEAAKTPRVPPPTPPRIPAVPETKLQGDLRETFIAGLPSILTGMRNLLQGLSKTDNETERLRRIQELCHQIHGLTGSVTLVGLNQIGQMAEALEALLKDLYDKPKNITVSPLRTLASAVDVLALLFERVNDTAGADGPPPRVLVVDDEAISRRAIMKALEKAKLLALSVDDPASAYNLLAGNGFDLVFLDVDMPGMTGFDLCAKLRALPLHKETPVVFVTSLDDLESRTSSTVSGGTDFIAKPFVFAELAVKALIYVMRARLRAVDR